MWRKIAYLLIRNRFLFLTALGALTLVMLFFARNVQVSYTMPRLLPDDDSTFVAYENFKARYGEENPVIVLGVDKDPFEDVAFFQGWHELGHKLKKIEGVDTIVSVAEVYNLVKNTEEKKFQVVSLLERMPENQTELDSVKKAFLKLPFYRELLYNDSTKVTLMAFSLDLKKFSSATRTEILDQVIAEVETFQTEYNIEVKYSGLPFIRTVVTEMVKQEMRLFIFLSLAVTVFILFLFFRSFQPIFISLLVVGIGVIFSLGTMGIFGYQISILTVLIPPLIIVIGVPNCIYLINMFHQEFRSHGNHALSLTRVVEKIGVATFMTNATTAAGFVTFIFTSTKILQEFGVVASINVMVIFIIAIVLIPILFSFFPPPKEKHTKHLDNKRFNFIVDFYVDIVSNHRKKIYLTTAVLLVIGFYGISKMVTTGNIVDDLPSDHKITKDLHFFEHHFHGVMPFEISIDAKKPGYASKAHTLRKIEELEDLFKKYPEFSRPISITEGIKFSRQAYYNGNPLKFGLINDQEKVFFKPYFESSKGSASMFKSFVDSTGRYTRVSVQVADMGTKKMAQLLDEIRPQIDSIFTPDKYKVDLTGTSVVFLAGTDYLINNLIGSLIFAVILISLLMALLFTSFPMVLISIVTNLIPLILTAAMMGYFGVSIKPSTILVFSIAFGIAVDDTIHYLSKFRLELKHHNNIKKAALRALKESGISMMYTSIVLFLGFSVFISSTFGGTQAIGLLISFTLFVAMFCNLIVLPSLLLSLDRRITMKAMKEESLLQIYDEEEDIDLEELKIKSSEETEKQSS